MNETVPFIDKGRGCVLCAEKVWYGAKIGRSWRLQLCNINLVARPGEVWACMGRSGSWMTSLMELLAAQRRYGHMSGRITYDGNDASPSTRHIATLVSREDHFSCVSTLTVREILSVGASLRQATPDETVVDDTLNLLGLDKCAHNPVGSSTTRGISGGEKKRLAIALGLVARPRLVLLNEPTTGLDSTTAFDVMQHVHESVALKQGRTVVATLHTPSADVYDHCDKLLLLTTDGHVAFAGPAREALSHIYAVVPSLNTNADTGKNPADILLAISAAPAWSDRLASAFEKSLLGIESFRAVAIASSEPITRIPKAVVTYADSVRQIRVLMWRALAQFGRSRAIWRTSILKMAWIAFLYSTTFRNQSLDATGAANLQSCFYFALMFGILGNLRGIITLFDERALFEHERANGAYTPLVYWIVTSCTQIPWLVFVNVLFSTVIFFSVGGTKVEGKYWVWMWYLLVTQFTNFVGFAWAQMLAAWSSSPQVAMSIWQPGVYIWSQTSGYPIKLPVISHSNPAYWLMYVSFTRWAYEAIIVGFFHAGWGIVSRTEVLAEYGYPKTPSLWLLILPLLLFVVLVRAITYPPLRERTGSLMLAACADLENSAMKASNRQTSTSVNVKSLVEIVDEKTPETKFDAISVDVEPLWYSVRVFENTDRKKVKPLLRGVSANVLPGEAMAVMGPSGAGKSTFLDLISGRKTTGFGCGVVKYNGVPPTQRQRHKQQCYVMQDDVLITNLTVVETVRIATMLRLENPTNESVTERTAKVVGMLGLIGCASTLIRGLATGERRLCAAAVEMVHLPSVMYLDEPTSGLDSKMSLEFVRTILRLASQGATVLCTIHQPTEQIFHMLPKVLVIGDGRTVFSGTPDEAAAYMLRIVNQTTTIVSRKRNVAEGLLDVAKTINCRNLREDGLLEPVSNGFDFDNALGGRSEASQMESWFGDSPSRQFYHFRVHLLRNILVLSHSRQSILVAVLRNICVAVWYGVVYCDQRNSHSIASVIYFSQQFITMSNLQAIPTLFAERALFYREISAGFYQVLPYLAARIMMNAIVQTPLVLTYCIITYQLVNLRGGLFSSYFVFFYCVLFGLSLAGYSFSNLVASITPNQQSALNLYSALFQFNMCVGCRYSFLDQRLGRFFCGYAIPINQIPSYWSWASHISFARWSFEALILNEFAGVSSDDDEDAEYWLKYWHFYGRDVSRAFFRFVCQVAIFHILALVAMRVVSFQRT